MQVRAEGLRRAARGPGVAAHSALLTARTLAEEAEHDGVAAVVALCWVLQPRRGAGARAGAEGTSAKRSAGPHRLAAPRATTATCWTWRAKTASARSPTFIAEFFDIIAP